MIILGSSALSISPLCCICLEELTFPIPETLSVNFMFFTSNLFSFIITILVSLPQIKKYGSWIFPATLFPYLIYILFWYKTDFFKSEHEGLCGSFNPKHIKEKNAVMKEFTPKQEKFEKTQGEIEITYQID